MTRYAKLLALALGLLASPPACTPLNGAAPSASSGPDASSDGLGSGLGGAGGTRDSGADVAPAGSGGTVVVADSGTGGAPANPCPINQAACPSGTGSLVVCIDIVSDAQNCGGCGAVCLLGQICHNAACVENTVDCSTPGATCQMSSCSSGTLSVSAAGGIVVDTGHMRRLWSRANQPPALFSQARSFCSGLTLEGVSGWRLPSYEELNQTLRGPGNLNGCGQCDPAIDQAAFPGVPQNATEWTTDPGPGGVNRLTDYCEGRSNFYGDVISDSEPYRCTHDPLP